MKASLRRMIEKHDAGRMMQMPQLARMVDGHALRPLLHRRNMPRIMNKNERRRVKQMPESGCEAKTGHQMKAQSGTRDLHQLNIFKSL